MPEHYMKKIHLMHEYLIELKKKLEEFKSKQIVDSFHARIQFRAALHPERSKADSLPFLSNDDFFLITPLEKAVDATIDRLNCEIGEYLRDNFAEPPRDEHSDATSEADDF